MSLFILFSICASYCTLSASATHYLIEHRLLLRSYDQEQKDTVGLTRQVVQHIKNVYLPRLAIDLWNRLNATSVFLEMFIDDIWILDDFRTSPKQQFRGFDIENYELCLKYISKLAEAEHTIYARARNMCIDGVTFEDVFGCESVCFHLLGGLENSLNAYFRKPDAYMEPILEKWKNKIKELKKLCSKIYSNKPI